MAHSALVIDCRQVTRTYNEGLGKLTIFSDISLEVAQGETVAIVGSSGAGKTTLLNLLGGLDKPSSGQISSFLPMPTNMIFFSNFTFSLNNAGKLTRPLLSISTSLA